MLLPLLYLMMVYPSLPAEVPTHFNAKGVADDWSAKWTLWIVIGGMQLFLYLLMKYAPNIDPKKNFNRFDKPYQKLRAIFQGFMVLLSVVVIYAAQGAEFDIRPGLTISLLVLLVLMGNYLQTVKPNYFIGIRTPWTLESEYVWTKTNRLIGRMWFYGGLICIGVYFAIPDEWGIFMVVIFTCASAAYSILHSFLLFKKQAKKES
jgi:uncharacterized membrane protein